MRTLVARQCRQLAHTLRQRSVSGAAVRRQFQQHAVPTCREQAQGLSAAKARSTSSKHSWILATAASVSALAATTVIVSNDRRSSTGQTGESQEIGRMLLQGKSLSEIASLYLTYRLCTVEALVKHGPAMISFLHSIGLGFLSDYVVGKTFFTTFCGGSDAEGIVITGTKLLREGLGTIVDYAAEEADFDLTSDIDAQRQLMVQRFSESIAAASQIANGSFVALRMTAFCPHRVLKKVSQICLEEYDRLDRSQTIFDQPGLLRQRLTDDELDAMRQASLCFLRLVQKANSSGVHIMLDAETWETQPAIDQLFLHTLRSSKEQTQAASRPTIFQTFQTYTRSCPHRLSDAIEFAKANDCPLAVKLVRGAYVEAETQRARLTRTPSPLWSTKEETDRCYNDTVVSFVDEIRTCAGNAGGPASLLLATHNEDSVRLGLQVRSALPASQRKRVFFAQLYGMGQELSYKAAQQAFDNRSTSVPDVYKYIPYGPLAVVTPYLARRATENLGMRSLAVHEYKQAAREIRHRLFGSI